MTARVTDWGLAALVAALLVTGVLTLFAGSPGAAWIIAVHDGCGIAIAILVVVKLRRVWPRLARGARNVDRRAAGIGAAVTVAACLLAGVLWSAGVAAAPAGYSLLSWHDALGAILAVAVATHMVVRAKRLRRRDLVGRRQFLTATGLAAGALVAWRAQRPFEALLALKGARRRFTGSYEAESFAGNAFPSTSWVADHPAPIDPTAYRLRVEGLTSTPAPCCRSGARRDRRARRHARLHRRLLLDPAVARRAPRPAPRPRGADAGARHVSVASVTGYRWSFAIDDARGLLLATHVGGAPLDHDHGAPIRLVVPGARGFEWVKWVTRIELRRDPDLGAPLSTLWSSFV